MSWLGRFRRSRYRGRHRHAVAEVSYEPVAVSPRRSKPVRELPRQRVELGYNDGSIQVVADPEFVARLQTAAARLRATTD
jgi:hypothetical protein